MAFSVAPLGVIQVTPVRMPIRANAVKNAPLGGNWAMFDDSACGGMLWFDET